MELDEIKDLLKSKLEEGPAPLTSSELEEQISKKTHSIIDKIKRSIRFELALGIFFVVIAVWAWFRYPFFYVRPFSMLCIALCSFLFIYFGALYKKISAYEQSALPVKDSLQKVIDIVQQFTRLYFQFNMVTLPIYFIFGLITLYLIVKGDSSIKNYNWQRGIFFYLGWFAIWAAVMYLFSKWYIKKLYGNYLVQLKQQLKDIENG